MHHHHHTVTAWLILAILTVVLFICIVAQSLFPLWVSLLCGTLIGLLIEVRQRPSMWDERD